MVGTLRRKPNGIKNRRRKNKARRPISFPSLPSRLLSLAHDALEHVADDVCSGLLLGLLVHGFSRCRRVGSGSGFLGALSRCVSLLDVDDLVLAQRGRVARSTSAPLEVLLGFATGAGMRLDVLGLACDVWVYVGLHVALASSSGRVCLRLDGRGFEIGGWKIGRCRRHVACVLQ